MRPADAHAFDAPEQLHQLETFANQTTLAVERARLAEEAQEAQVRVESERLRSSLLSAVSHDLRTRCPRSPDRRARCSRRPTPSAQADRRQLLESIREEAERLNQLVQNLLEMTRLEAGAVVLRREWHALEEVIGAAIARVRRGPARDDAGATRPATGTPARDARPPRRPGPDPPATPDGGGGTAPMPASHTTCASTWPSSAASWRPTPHSRAPC